MLAFLGHGGDAEHLQRLLPPGRAPSMMQRYIAEGPVQATQYSCASACADERTQGKER